MKFFARSRVWKPIVIVLAAIAVVWGAAVIISTHITHSLSENDAPDTKGYEGRSVMIYEAGGTADAECGDRVYGAYTGMQLLDENDLHTYSESYLKIQVDDDKYILIDENTSAELCAPGDQGSDETELTLTEGTVIVRIENLPADDAYFRVETPNTSADLKDGIYRIESGTNESGIIFTEIDACGGEVDFRTVRLDGTTVSEGYTVIQGTRSVVSGSGSGVNVQSNCETMDYSDYSLTALTFLDEMIQQGGTISIGQAELAERIRTVKLPYYTVTFLYEGKVFGTQSVRAEDTAQKPTLKPAPEGQWDFDFSKAINEDITIEWIETEENQNR